MACLLKCQNLFEIATDLVGLYPLINDMLVSAQKKKLLCLIVFSCSFLFKLLLI